MIRTANAFLGILLASLTAITSAQDGSVPPKVAGGISLPSDFPEFSPATDQGTSPGNIFLTNSQGKAYLMILKNDGTPYFYRQVEESSLDFKLQANGMLSCWTGGISRGYMRMDAHFQIIDTLRCQHGYDTDAHEMILLPNGHALLIALEERLLTELDPGANPNSVLIGNHIQEIDSSGAVVFQWLCWDHFSLEDSYIESMSAIKVDYIHMNSIAVDFDGHLLISSRHLSECTKINRQTGEIIWRLGGKNNQFDFVNDPDQFSYQHDFRPVPGKPGHYTLFDNGNQRDPKYSRAVEYRLDTLNMRVEKMWEYRHDPERYSRLMGNVQRLPNGNTLINWGGADLPVITELDPDSEVVYEADFSTDMNNYRTFRFACDYVMEVPYLLVEPYPDRLRLLMNQFGDTDIAYYKIYAGEHPDQLERIDSTSLPWIDLQDLEAPGYWYLHVSSVDGSGIESAASNLERVYVRNAQAGDNLIINGSFSQGDSFWTHQNLRDASSSGSIADSIYRFNIDGAGLVSSDVQLIQVDVPLIQGMEYVLELDARADAPRTIGVELERNDVSWESYSRHGMTYIGTQFTRIEHSFRMEHPNDLKARFVIYGGGSDIDFEVSNISLRQKVETTYPQQRFSSEAVSCYPNPADKETFLSFESTSSTKMHLQVFTITGQLLNTVDLGTRQAGRQEIRLSTASLDPGAYVLQISEGGISLSCVLLVRH